MEFICSKREFEERYAHPKNFISNKSSLPILSNILIEVKDSKLQLFGSDLETHCRCNLTANIIKEGSLAVPAKKLSDIIHSFPNDSEILFSKLDSNRLRVKENNDKVKIKIMLQGFTKEGYPQFPTLKEAHKFSIKQDLLKKMIKKTIYAASKDGLQPKMEGICFDRRENQLNLVASDGKRLALMTTPFENKTIDDFKIVVSSDVLKELSRVLGDSGDCKIGLTNKEIEFQTDDVQFISNLFDCDFPNYQLAISKKFKHEVFVDTMSLFNSIQMLSHMADPLLNRIEFEFTKESLLLFSEHPDLGQAKDELIMESYEGADKEKIAFNYHFLRDALREIEDEKVCIKFNDNKGPIMFQGTEDKTFFSIVMPMKRRED